MRITFYSITSIKILFLVFAIHTLHAMKDTSSIPQIQQKQTYSEEELILLKGNFRFFPNDIIYLIENIANDFSVIQKFNILNSYFNKLFTEKMLQKLAVTNVYDKYLHTPLTKAIEKQNFSLIIALINKGANVNKPTLMGKSPLYIATKHSEGIATLITQILLEHGADVNASNNNSNTALGNALHDKKYDLAQLFIKYRINLNRPVNSLGETPLQFVTQTNDKKAIDLITRALQNQNKKQKK